MILNLVPLWPQPQIISIEKNPSPKLLRDIEFGPTFGIFKRCGFWWLSDFHVTHLSGLPTKVLTVDKASTTHHLRCLWPFLQAQQLIMLHTKGVVAVTVVQQHAFEEGFSFEKLAVGFTGRKGGLLRGFRCSGGGPPNRLFSSFCSTK